MYYTDRTSPWDGEALPTSTGQQREMRIVTGDIFLSLLYTVLHYNHHSFGFVTRQLRYTRV